MIYNKGSDSYDHHDKECRNLQGQPTSTVLVLVQLARQPSISVCGRKVAVKGIIRQVNFRLPSSLPSSTF
jgi:hypothetical protein